MPQIEYRRSMQSQYVILHESEGKEAVKSGFRENMLLHNSINGLLPLELRYVNNTKMFYYDISGRTALSTVYDTRQFSLKELKSMICSLLGVICHGREYFLEECDYMISPDTIFIGEKEYEIAVPYYPGYRVSLQKQLEELSEYLMNRVDYHDERAVLFIYTFYMKCKEESCTLDVLLNITSDYNEDKPSTRVSADDVEKNNILKDTMYISDITQSEVEKQYYPGWVYITGALIGIAALTILLFAADLPLFYNIATGKRDIRRLMVLAVIVLCAAGYGEYRIWGKRNQKSRVVKIKSRLTMNEAKEDLINMDEREYIEQITDISYRLPSEQIKEMSLESGYIADNVAESRVEGKVCEDNVEARTEYLFTYGDGKPICVLIPHPGEAIQVMYTPFYIGKDMDKVDFCLKTTGISRLHAKLEKRQEGVYLTDLNSMNGTYINGVRIEAHTGVLLAEKDEITFARASYSFTLEYNKSKSIS